MTKTPPETRFRAVFTAPAWPGEYVSKIEWMTELAAGYYAASVLAQPEAWMTETPSENPVFLHDLHRFSLKGRGEEVEVRIERRTHR